MAVIKRKSISWFDENRADINTLEFAKSRIQDFYDYEIKGSQKGEQDAIKKERDREKIKIDRIIEKLEKNRRRIDDWSNEIDELCSMVKSACEIYLKHLEAKISRIGINTFDEIISKVNAVLDAEEIKEAKGGLYDKYYSGKYCEKHRRCIIPGTQICNGCPEFQYSIPV